MSMAAISWDKIEKSPKADQDAFFNKNLKQEPIRSFDEIREGDHIVFETDYSKYYYHHCLCIDHKTKGKPIVIHYYGTPSEAVYDISGTSCKNFGAAAKVQRTQLPDNDNLKNEADFKKKNVQRIVWPPEIRRYSVKETIKRALRREGESYYDMVKNNCEHFVMWCMCGINTSLQVKSYNTLVFEMISGILHTLKNQVPRKLTEEMLNAAARGAVKLADRAIQYAVKQAPNFFTEPIISLDWSELFPKSSFRPELFGQTFNHLYGSWNIKPLVFHTGPLNAAYKQGLFAARRKELFASLKVPDSLARGGDLGVDLSVGFGVLLETVHAGYKIYEKYKQFGEGTLIASSADFVQSTLEVIGASACRLGGAAIGQMFIPAPFLGALVGSSIGTAVGSYVGHYFGHYFGKLFR